MKDKGIDRGIGGCIEGGIDGGKDILKPTEIPNLSYNDNMLN
jgi:hypothetical protein